MDEIYIKINQLHDYDIRMFEKLGYYSQDLISIGDLLNIIDNLLDEKSHLEDQINEMKEPIDYEDDHNGFDYGEWKMSIDNANGR